MLLPLVDDRAFEIMLQQVQVILHPFLALWLDFLERVELDLVFARVDVVHLDIILLREPPQP